MKNSFLGAMVAFLIFSVLLFTSCSQTETSVKTEISAEKAITETEVVSEATSSHITDMTGEKYTMGENTEKIVCSCCGYILSTSQKFCPECGAALERPSASSGAAVTETDTSANTGMSMGSFMGMGMGMNSAVQQDPDAEPVNIYPDDSGLRLMVDCCDKTGPLAGGFVQVRETVLYYDEKTDGYQVHTYASNGYGSGKHEGYYTTKEHAERVMQSIDEDTVLKYKDLPEPCGGSRILKFRNEKDEMIRAECSMAALSKIKNSVEGLLSEAVKPENRIVPEEAKNWKKCVIFSTGMSMDSCYNYEIERMENGKVRVRGKCFITGIAHEHENWIELSEKEAAELENIPLGLMLSDIVTDPNPMMGAGFAGTVLDGDSLSVSITYADGKRDRKIPDREMIRTLNELMKRVF